MTKERSKRCRTCRLASSREHRTWRRTPERAVLPKGTPADVVKKLSDAALQAMKTPGVRERLEGLGAVIVSDDRATPEHLGQFLKAEIEKWAAPIKASGVSVE